MVGVLMMSSGGDYLYVFTQRWGDGAVQLSRTQDLTSLVETEERTSRLEIANILRAGWVMKCMILYHNTNDASLLTSF
jgi:hypothetical protein